MLFENLALLRRLKHVDFSGCNIFDKGIEGICPHIGLNIKSVLETIKLDRNEVSDKGLRKLLTAVEKKVNKISRLSFVDSQITNEGAFFVQNWLKKQRMRDVAHNLNMVTCDLTLNKVMFKQLREIETQLAVNRKFQ